MPPLVSLDYVAAAMAALAAVVGMAHRRLPRGVGLAAFMLGLSAAATWAGYRLTISASDDALLIRMAAALAVIWAACGWAARGHVPAETDVAGGRRGGEASASFFIGALLFGTVAIGLILFVLATFGAHRVLSDYWDEPGHGLRREGASDIVALGLALLFWRLTQRDRFQPTLALGLAGLLAVWLSFIIPGTLLGGPADDFAVRQPWLPEWWSWTLNLQAVLSAVLLTGVWLQNRSWRAHRSAAWPDQLERLLAPFPRWPGFRELYASYAACALILGVYHVVRPGAITIPSGLVGAVTLAAAGLSCLFSAHRRRSDNLAGLGLALITIAVVTLACMLARDDPGIEYERRLPLRLNAAVLGLTFMSFLLMWLARFWDQQLLDGRPWTTAGWMIPLAARTGFMIAALGVLVAYHMTIWPRMRVAIGADASAGRWVAGLSAIGLLAVVCGRAARRRDEPALAMLSIAAAIAGPLFVFIRWPPGEVRGWLVQHSAVVLALLALGTLALAEAVPRSRWRVFATPLWFLALLVLPAASLRNLAGRPAGEWLPTMTFTILAATYGLAAQRAGRRVFYVLMVVLFLLAIGSAIHAYRPLFSAGMP